MNIEMNSVLLTIMITCIAFIGAANSRGTTRMVVSYILAFICLAVTTVFITQFFSAVSKNRAEQIATQAGKIIENRLEEIGEMESNKLEQASSALEKQASTSYKASALELVSQMKSLNSRLSNMRLSPGSDEEYETLLGQSSQYLGESFRYKKEVKALEAPADMKSIQNAMVDASESVADACGRLKRYFNAENAQEELDASQSFRNKARQSELLLVKLETELSH